jgi:hypothetical protein
MPWIRLSDDYFDDEKIRALSDGAFRLWHEGLAFSRRNQTDGLIPFPNMRCFQAWNKGREKQLATPYREGVAPLWELIPAMGYKIHNYLRWNQSKDDEKKDRTGARERMRKLRSSYGVTFPNKSEQTRDVPEMEIGIGSFPEEGSGEKPPESLAPDDLAQRAAQLLYRYKDLYAKHRNGARLCLLGNSVEFEAAVKLCREWDDTRLDKLAQIVLTTDDTFISGTDRSFRIFSLKASWADDRLRQVESRAS